MPVLDTVVWLYAEGVKIILALMLTILFAMVTSLSLGALVLLSTAFECGSVFVSMYNILGWRRG